MSIVIQYLSGAVSPSDNTEKKSEQIMMHIIGLREGIRTTCTIQLYRTYSGSSAQQLGGITGILQAENTSQLGQAEVADHIGHISNKSKHGGEQGSNESTQSA